eukprot:COSAG01_NODE_3303_length_6294_cov_3.018402_1_plen_85_part_00
MHIDFCTIVLDAVVLQSPAMRANAPVNCKSLIYLLSFRRLPHILLGPGAACMFLTHYEINLDQRILDPEICMHACMAGRPAGRR